MKAISIICAIVGALLLASCASSKVITGPDGTNHLLVTCESIEYCYEKAREDCGGKYKIINTSSEVTGTEMITTSSNQLLIKCERDGQTN
ncbi:MAG: hypothetical protein HRT61_20335 [Ekhidna sp.]|nr:hypothetical protein [Ekhidna sp.]